MKTDLRAGVAMLLSTMMALMKDSSMKGNWKPKKTHLASFSQAMKQRGSSPRSIKNITYVMPTGIRGRPHEIGR